jgi:hypothetical protein
MDAMPSTAILLGSYTHGCQRRAPKRGTVTELPRCLCFCVFLCACVRVCGCVCVLCVCTQRMLVNARLPYGGLPRTHLPLPVLPGLPFLPLPLPFLPLPTSRACSPATPQILGSTHPSTYLTPPIQTHWRARVDHQTPNCLVTTTWMEIVSSNV